MVLFGMESPQDESFVRAAELIIDDDAALLRTLAEQAGLLRVSEQRLGRGRVTLKRLLQRCGQHCFDLRDLPNLSVTTDFHFFIEDLLNHDPRVLDFLLLTLRSARRIAGLSGLEPMRPGWLLVAN